MGRNIIQLNEKQLRKLIKESVRKALKEEEFGNLSHFIDNYDPTREEEYSDLDRLIIKLEPYYNRLSKDTFFYNQEPVDRPSSLTIAKKMCAILNEYFGGDYFDIVRGGANLILSDEAWFNGEYDMAEEFYNYSIEAKRGTPYEIGVELAEISDGLAHGYLPDALRKNKSQANDKEQEDREKNGGLKVLGKIDLSKVDPKGMNKKRW